jgi:hypothetical protein
MEPPRGGFLRPGSQSNSAFGIKFDRPQRGGQRRGDNRSTSAAHAGKRKHNATVGQLPSSGSDDDDTGFEPGPPGLFPEGVRGPDLPPMNPSYRYGDPSLPVSRYRRQILSLIEDHATTIIVGETGSGKTTQVPQFLFEAGWAENGFSIAITQPRRVAATTVAARVAEEMGCDVGTTVGYVVRFDNAVTAVSSSREVGQAPTRAAARAEG